MKKIICLFLSLLLFPAPCKISAEENNVSIKMYIFYTPSHEILYKDWFFPTLQDDYKIICECYDQKCPSGKYMRKGWIETMFYKVDLIIRAIKENWDGIFIHSDVDIQFFGPTWPFIEAAMKNNDIVLQRERPEGEVCIGFFACKGNERTLALFEEVKKRLIEVAEKKRRRLSIQKLLNRALRDENIYEVKWDYLSPYYFFCGGNLTNSEWEPGETLPIPETIVMHHANFTMTIENKIAQLRYVNTEVKQRRLGKTTDA